MLLSPDSSNPFLLILIQFSSYQKQKPKIVEREKSHKKYHCLEESRFPLLTVLWCPFSELYCYFKASPKSALLLAWGKGFLQKGTQLSNSTAAIVLGEKTGFAEITRSTIGWMLAQLNLPGIALLSSPDLHSCAAKSLRCRSAFRHCAVGTWLKIWKCPFVSKSSEGSWVWLDWSHRAIF